MEKQLPIFITGASGFIGGHLARQLLLQGRLVRVLSRRPLPHLENLGAQIIIGDLNSQVAILQGCQNAYSVFHVAGHVRSHGPVSIFNQVNVDGTRNVIAACRALGVRNLIFTSSPSVVYANGNLSYVDESASICKSAPSAYPTSKAAAEELVRCAHSTDLRTISLRPHLVWGPGDKNVVPKILSLARSNKLWRLGSGKNIVDLTHIDNVVDAHILAENALSRVAGLSQHAYFISNDEPVVLWDWVNEILAGTGLQPITRRMPISLANIGGCITEIIWRLTRRTSDPPLNRFLLHALASDHYFNINAAKRDLGYVPKVSMKNGMDRLLIELNARAR